jgi:hypothetical protein
MEKTRFTFVMAPKVREKINKIAQARGLGMSELVRMWIAEGIERYDKA